MAIAIRIVFPILVLFAGCTGSSGRGQLLKDRERDRGVTEREVRAELLDFVRLFDQAVAGTADGILHETDDVQLRRRAILWKIHAVPACQAAAFQESPSLGLIDVWTLVLQMDAHFRDGEGRERFGAFQPRVLATCQRLVDMAQQLTSLLPGSDPDVTRKTIGEWVASHPITDDGRVRPSPMSEISRLLGPRELSTIDAVVSMEQHVADLTFRLGMYAESMPRQVRWQGELMTEEMFQRPKFQESLRDFAVMASSLEELAGYESVIHAQIDEAMGKMDRLTDGLLASVDDQRSATLTAVTEERKAILEEVDRQRTATLSAVQEEREAILEAATDSRIEIEKLVRNERDRTVADAERIVNKSMNQGSSQARELIDHLFLRAVQAGAALIGMALVAALIYRLTPSRGSCRPSPGP
ncbi:MAG: hypothetical protein ACYS0E_01005 [Planctomycetota bacterium]|jgi:hypothetical protein